MGSNQSSQRPQEGVPQAKTSATTTTTRATTKTGAATTTATTAKSQVMAIICAPITEARRTRNNAIVGGDVDRNDDDDAAADGTVAAPAHSVGTPPPPPPSMLKWIQSTTCAFREWAEDWVLRPSEEAAFNLPIAEHFLFVSVSPTLGVVRHSWYRGAGVIEGCVGSNRVLVRTHYAAAISVTDHGVYEVVGGDGEAPKEVAWVPETRCRMICCSSKWIAGYLPNGAALYVWKVAELGGDAARCERHFDGVHARATQFSPLSDDVLLVFASCEAEENCVTFCDLQASVNEGKLVVTRKVPLGERHTDRIIWRPDGSVCTLHSDSSAKYFVDNATGKQLVQFPQSTNVFPVVYHTGSITSEPSHCVPCTWAAPSVGVQSQLIASTTHHAKKDRRATEIKFSVHDCSTGFHVGDFIVPFDSSHFKFREKM
ncbi:hypothetical protein Pelo_11830 [Pelomyxa schiedti]|nr:hypothetical protein Pelo_11830 [Pelomyxa schiedti]